MKVISGIAVDEGLAGDNHPAWRVPDALKCGDSAVWQRDAEIVTPNRSLAFFVIGIRHISQSGFNMLPDRVFT
jgi:hypothetical protein